MTNFTNSTNTGSTRIGTPKNSILSSHSEAFRIKLFVIWLQNNSPRAMEFWEMLGPEGRFDTELSKEVSQNDLRTWVSNWDSYGWALSERAVELLENQIVSDRVEMLRRQIPQLVELQNMAMAYLREKGLQGARNAITAFFQALKLEQLGRGVNLEELEQISKMDDSQLVATLEAMATKGVQIENSDGSLQTEAVTRSIIGGGQDT